MRRERWPSQPPEVGEWEKTACSCCHSPSNILVIALPPRVYIVLITPVWNYVHHSIILASQKIKNIYMRHREMVNFHRWVDFQVCVFCLFVFCVHILTAAMVLNSAATPKDLHILTKQLTNDSVCNLEFKCNSRFWYITVLMCNPITFNSGYSRHVYWSFLTKNWSGEKNCISSKSLWYNWGTGSWGRGGERGRKQIRSVQLGCTLRFYYLRSYTMSYSVLSKRNICHMCN